jgi:lysozyme family protein
MDKFELWQMWEKLTLTTEPAMLHEIMQAMGNILVYSNQYKNVGDQLGNVPYYAIGCLHYRESNFNFQTHLANGDPLTNSTGNPIATTHVPIGLGPYNSWVDAAVGALKHAGWDKIKDWDLVSTIYHLHSYNGWGPEKSHHTFSGYIWSGTQIYTNGKYVQDGVWDPNAPDMQAGCAAILSMLKAHGINLNEVIVSATPIVKSVIK